MNKYRKKPVVIEAFQMTDTRMKSNENWPQWMHDAFNSQSAKAGDLFYKNYPEELTINTLEGQHHVSLDDFIIQGVQGELYPCKPDIFEATYEKVE